MSEASRSGPGVDGLCNASMFAAVTDATAAGESPELVDTIVGVLTENGPMTEDALLAELDQRGIELGGDPELALDEFLGDEVPVMRLSDDRLAWLPALLAGRVFTHRLTGAEVEHDILLGPDLDPIVALTEYPTYQRLADGSPIVEVLLPFDTDALAERGIPLELVGDDGALLLPPGYLAPLGAAASDLIGLRLADDGLRLETAGEPTSAAPGSADRLSALLETVEPLMLVEAVWTACADDPSLFAEPVRPLAALLEAGRLRCDGGWVAREGFDFRQWRAEKRCASIAARHDLSAEEALAVLAIRKLYEQVVEMHAVASAAYEDGGDAALRTLLVETTEVGDVLSEPETRATDTGERATVRASLAFLAEPAVAQAVLLETAGTDEEGAAPLGLFAETLEPMAPRAARPALRWLRAKALELLDDVVEAEQTYQAAESLDPGWPLPLVDLARFASDRGDATRALALLRRAEAPADHSLVELLGRFHAEPRSDLGRNAPCWCGSGRKYKKCHLGREVAPLEERAGWLYEKAGMFLVHGPWRADLIEVAAERAAYADSEYALRSAATDPLVTDAVLFEGGAFEHFVGTRGVLLPDDERLLAEQWLLIERSVFEVETVQRGAGLTVRELRTGDVHQVRERTASRRLKAGDLVCARVVPAGNTMQIFGGIEPVGLHQRDELIGLLDSEPSAIELVGFLTRRFAPPALTNTEGDPLVFCDATLRVSGPAALTAALDETYDRADDTDTPEWIEHVTTHGIERIRATLRLKGTELSVHANSEARFDRVLDTLRALDPTITVITEDRQPARDGREAAELSARTPHLGAGPLDPADPDVRAALEQFVREYEEKWLDEPIPALAGLTPRQAANDPTRRGDLVRLLDSFPEQEGNPGAMDIDRLRAALGLR